MASGRSIVRLHSTGKSGTRERPKLYPVVFFPPRSITFLCNSTNPLYGVGGNCSISALSCVFLCPTHLSLTSVGRAPFLLRWQYSTALQGGRGGEREGVERERDPLRTGRRPVWLLRYTVASWSCTPSLAALLQC